MSNQLLSQEETQKLTEIFKAIDKNHDGIVSKDELIQGYTYLHGSTDRAQLVVD